MDLENDIDGTKEESRSSNRELENKLYSASDFSGEIIISKKEDTIKYPDSPNKPETISSSSSESTDDDVVFCEKPMPEIIDITTDESNEEFENADSSSFGNEFSINLRVPVQYEREFISLDYQGECSELSTSWEKVESPKSWTIDMRKFYNKPCNELRSFDHYTIIRGLRKENNYWPIQPNDRLYPSKNKREKQRETSNSTEGNNCIMCGLSHSVYHCPSKMCLNCGTKNRIFVSMCSKCVSCSKVICKRCNQQGHKANNCPDVWRQYHSTIGQNINKKSTRNPKKHCSNCGKLGHYYENCKNWFWSPYPSSSCFVTKYADDSESTVVNHKRQKNPKAKISKIQATTPTSPYIPNLWSRIQNCNNKSNSWTKLKLKK